MSNAARLRRDAESIWRAGVAAVDSKRLVADVVRNTGAELVICGHPIPLAKLNRLVVVGAGKAGAGMAAGFEQAAGAELVRDRLNGWVNVPADCVGSLQSIHLHAARPAGINEPTEEGARGVKQILELVAGLGEKDVCVVLLSGGGSALLPAPVAAITLADKQQVTRMLMHAGATIDELNCVRKQLSLVKGGGLARATQAGLVMTLIISDVIGDPLDVIASGPTVADSSTAADALAVLRKYAPNQGDVSLAVTAYLTRKRRNRHRSNRFHRPFIITSSATMRSPCRRQRAGPPNSVMPSVRLAVRMKAKRRSSVASWPRCVLLCAMKGARFRLRRAC